MARTVDHISDGRLILGIGSGWKERTTTNMATSSAPSHPPRRPGRALPRIKSRLTKLNPAPTRDIPILIGGKGPKKTLRLVAEHGDIWHGFTTVDSYPQAAEILADHCKAVGRDPTPSNARPASTRRVCSPMRKGWWRWA